MNNIIFFDIDGTLANGLDVPDSAQKAIKETRALGNKVLICTGRGLSYVMAYFKEYADGYITSNGRFGILDQSILFDHPLTDEQRDYYISKLRSLHASFTLYEQNDAYFDGDYEVFKKEEKHWNKGYLQYGLKEDMHPYNFDIYFQNDQHFDKIREALKDECVLNYHTGLLSADVTIIGYDKGTAIKEAAQALNVPMGNTYAFGDGYNDITMIKNAGHGIVMGNGVEALKQEAEYITTAIDDDGVRNGLKKYGLIE